MKVFKYLLFCLLTIAAALGLLLWKAPQTALQWGLAVERHAAGLERKHAILPSGERIVYLEGGQGAPLVLIHGFGANKDNFTRVAKDLTGQYRVVIPDLVGFGESDRPHQADYTTAAQADRLDQLATLLNLGNQLHLGGSSMGGHIAMAWAASHPARIKSMWLLNPGGIWSAPKSRLMKDYEATGKMPLIISSEDDMLALMSLVMSKPPYMPEVLLRAAAHENMPHQALLQRILETISTDSIEPRLKNLKTPTLIVWGSEDQVLSAATAPVLHRLLPQSKVILMQGVGHLPMLEAVDQAAHDYLRFRSDMANSSPAG